jgi:hypothetical protein
MPAGSPTRTHARDVPALHATSTQAVIVDEDRLWVQEFVDVAPARNAPVRLSPAARRLLPPPEALAGVGGALRIGTGPLVDVDLADGAVLLPEEIPPDGVTAVLEYSLDASAEAVTCARRYPVPLMDLRVSVTANIAGFRVAVSDGEAARAALSGPRTWNAVATRSAPLEAGSPVSITVAGLPAYRLPPYAKAGLVLAALLVAGGLALGLLAGRRAPPPG